MKHQSWRIVSGKRRSEMRGDVSHQQPTAFLMQADGPTQNPRQQGTERHERHQSPLVFDQEHSAEVRLATLHLRARLSILEVGLDIVVAESPAGSLNLRAHVPQRLEKFK